MLVLLLISSILCFLGFSALVFLPAEILVTPVVITAVVSASLGCLGLVIYGVISAKKKLG